MKAVIKEVTFRKERDTQYGKLYDFAVKYDDKTAFYSSKFQDQKKFVAGQEAEFTEEERQYTDKKGNPATYIVIKPIKQMRQSNFGKALTREQSRYSGFADSYAKDLLVAGVLRPEKTEGDIEHNDVVMITWKARAMDIFLHMIELDKSLEQ